MTHGVSYTGLARARTCDEPTVTGRCRERPTGGYNPLRFCADHLALYRERIRLSGGEATAMGDEAPTLVIG